MKLAQKRTAESHLEKVEQKDPFQALETLRGSKGCVDEEGVLLEPYRQFVFLKLMGRKPLLVLRMLDVLQHSENKTGGGMTRSEVAQKLGVKYKSGTPYMEVGRYLDALGAIGIIHVNDSGERRYARSEFAFLFTSTSASSLLDGETPRWNAAALHQLLQQHILRTQKVRGLDGTTSRIDAVKLLEDLVRSDCDILGALQILQSLVPPKESPWSLTNLVREIMGEIERRYPGGHSQAFVMKQKLGVVVSDAKSGDVPLGYELVEGIMMQLLDESGFVCAPQHIVRELCAHYVTIVIGSEKRSVERSDIVSQLSNLFFRLYNDDIRMFTSHGQSYLGRSRRYLDIGQGELEPGQPAEVLQIARTALYYSTVFLLVKHGLLPDKDADGTIRLLSEILESPDNAANLTAAGSTTPKLLCREPSAVRSSVDRLKQSLGQKLLHELKETARMLTSRNNELKRMSAKTLETTKSLIGHFEQEIPERP